MTEARRIKPQEALPHLSAYELLLRVAAGGMGTVFIARKKNSRVGRLYALKRTHPHLLAEVEYLSTIAREGWLTSRIQHANVVAVHDVEEIPGEFLLVMDYVNGVSASAVVPHAAGHAPFFPAIVRIIADAAAGLHAAHQLRDEHGRYLNVVHRDVSPGNLLVGLDGLTRVADFGVAKATTQHWTRTASGIVQGKVAYMSPEQAAGEKLDARTDVFALGVVAWELLCGQRMFPGANDIEILHAITRAPRTPPSHKTPALAWADPIIMAAVDVSRDKRPPTAEAFADRFLQAAHSAGMVGEPADVAALVAEIAGPALEARTALLREVVKELDGVASRDPAARGELTISPVGDESPRPPPRPRPEGPSRDPQSPGRARDSIGGAMRSPSSGTLTVVREDPGDTVTQVAEPAGGKDTAEPLATVTARSDSVAAAPPPPRGGQSPVAASHHVGGHVSPIDAGAGPFEATQVLPDRTHLDSSPRRAYMPASSVASGGITATAHDGSAPKGTSRFGGVLLGVCVAGVVVVAGGWAIGRSRARPGTPAFDLPATSVTVEAPVPVTSDSAGAPTESSESPSPPTPLAASSPADDARTRRPTEGGVKTRSKVPSRPPPGHAPAASPQLDPSATADHPAAKPPVIEPPASRSAVLPNPYSKSR